MESPENLTRMIEVAGRGDPQAAAQLLAVVYDELRRLAARRLAAEAPGHTLEATALVHEAYLRLLGGAGQDQHWQGRRHFFGAAAEAMRRILVDSARQRRAQKRGGDRARQDLAAEEIAAPARSEDLLALDEALEKLAVADAPAAEIVKLRYFAGLSVAEAAKVLDVSPRTAARMWDYARAWLHQQLRGEDG